MKSSPFGLNITYYDVQGNKSSNVTDLVKKNGFKEFTKEGITSYLTFRYPIGEYTMFEGIKKVPCGSEIKNNKISAYWYPTFPEKEISFDLAMKKIEELLINEIKRLGNGKKIAVPLSGGVDSSLILAMCTKVFPDKKIYSYSAGFYGDDEFEYSRLIAEECKSVHTEKVLGKDDYIGENSLLNSLVKFKGEPLHPNELALAYIERMAKKDGCQVAMCGEGADDIFGGYGQNLRMYLNYKNKEKPFFKFFLNNYRYFSLEDRESIINPDWLVDDFDLLMEFMPEDEIPSMIENKVFYFTQKFHTVGLITRGANAMRFNGLDTGFPYIGQELVNFVNSMPFDYKVHWKSEDDAKKAENMNFREVTEKFDVPKYILKKVAEDYLPEKIIYRPKKGFPVPFQKWLEDLKEWPLEEDIFISTNISKFTGWKKFMLINLDTMIKEFKKYKK